MKKSSLIKQTRHSNFFLKNRPIFLFLIFVANYTVTRSAQLYFYAQSCMTVTEIQSDSRCLYIYNSDVYQMGTKNSPHHGHDCGSDVSADMPPNHRNNTARYLDPRLVGSICESTPVPTTTPQPTNTPQSTNTPKPTNTPQPTQTSAPVPTNTLSPNAPTSTAAPNPTKTPSPKPYHTPVKSPAPTQPAAYGGAPVTIVPTPTDEPGVVPETETVQGDGFRPYLSKGSDAPSNKFTGGTQYALLIGSARTLPWQQMNGMSAFMVVASLVVLLIWIILKIYRRLHPV